MKIIVLGAGPIGIEFAALALEKGHEVKVYEKGEVGQSISRWQHVQLFSDWPLNVSAWGMKRLGFVPEEGKYPTGEAFLTEYLRPLAKSLGDVVETQTEILGVTRNQAIKTQYVGSRKEKAGGFRVLLKHQNVERVETADFLVDASGVYEQPSNLGMGGLPAINESKFEHKIERYEVNSLTDSDRYSGKRVLVVGGGYSAVTSIRELLKLKNNVPSTLISWSVLKDPPYVVLEDDALPARKRIAQLGNALISKKKDGVSPYVGYTLSAIHDDHEGAMKVTLESENDTLEIVVDVIVSNVGYRPDNSILRELHFHMCYASEGPMNLSASLLAAEGSSEDCLTQVSPGVDTLRNPEPNLFVLGAKSYGRNSNFLLRLGFEQIEAVIETL